MIQFGSNFSTLGVPETGLFPTITIRDNSNGNVVVNAAAMIEVGGGAYKYDFTNDTAKKYSAIVDGGVDTLDSRYMTAWSERAKTEAESVLILEDTNELQENQGNWVTATGFATENPPSQILNDYKADVSGLAPANEYDVVMGTIAGDVAGLNGEAMRGSDGIPDNPLLTNDIRLNNIDATISSRSSHADPTNSIKGTPGKTNQEVFDNEKGTDGAYTGTPPTVEEIQDRLEGAGTKLTIVKDQTDKMNFTGTDIKATLDGEEVTTNAASRNASKATGFATENPPSQTLNDYKATGFATENDIITINEKLARILGLMHENIYIDNPAYDSDNNLISARVRIYSVAGSVGTVNDVLATYNITSDGSSAGKFENWSQVKV